MKSSFALGAFLQDDFVLRHEIKIRLWVRVEAYTLKEKFLY